ncbi:hypothetical protein [Photobacterium chitinilyticum]|nr:hypothetical protein [Photobacterium chitinilyticum]
MKKHLRVSFLFLLFLILLVMSEDGDDGGGIWLVGIAVVGMVF